jgi:DNA-damage-inducible protein D
VECWSARELQNLLGYSKWENFSKVIDKAKESCENAGEKTAYHFPDVRKTVKIGSGAEKSIAPCVKLRVPRGKKSYPKAHKEISRRTQQ